MCVEPGVTYAVMSNVEGVKAVAWVPTAQIALTPVTSTNAVGTPYNATAQVTDGAGHGVEVVL